jgi:cytosine/adenosine deaminase-related metal-dependent hydrolase
MNDAGIELADVSIGIEDGWISAVGPVPNREFDRRIDCRNLLAFPGFVNTHHHLYQTLTRAFPGSRGQTLFPWLQQLYPIWAGLDEEMVAASTRVGLAELALTGCTTSADHLYVFPPGSEHFMDAEIAAADEIGLRFHPTRGSMDLSEKDGGLPPDSVVQSIDAILSDSERVIQRYHNPNPGAMARIALAPCSPFSVTPELMKESARLARQYDVRLHTHIAETLDEDAYSREQFGLSPVQLLQTLDWLAPDVWVAHCVHPDDADVESMARSSTSVAHCPTSNMLLGSGLAPVRRFLDAGIPVGIGVDGSASNDANDMRQEVKQSVLVSRVRDGAAAMPVRDAVRLATRGGAAALARDDIGSLEPGKAADIALFDITHLTTAGGEEDPIAAVILGSTRPSLVVVNGEVIVEDGHLSHHDEAQLAAQLNAASRRLLSRRA